MKGVVFDTSFIVNCIKNKVDFLMDIKIEIGNFDIIIPSPVISELKFLSKKNINAKIGLELLEKKGYTLIESEEPADLAITEIALKNQYFVASTDWAVRRRSSRKGLNLITLRQGKRIYV